MIRNRRQRTHTLSCWCTEAATTAPCGSQLSNAWSSSATRRTPRPWRGTVKMFLRTSPTPNRPQSIVDFIVDQDLTEFVLVGHGYAGTIISRVVEIVPERVRRLVFWSAYVLNDGESALEMLPDSVELLMQMAADSADNTFMIPFDMWRDVFINDGEPNLVQRAYDQLSREPFGPWAEPLNMEKFHSLHTPRSFLVGTADMVMPPGDSGWHPRMSSRLGQFRLVQMSGSHEAIITNPIGLADKLIEAGR